MHNDLLGAGTPKRLIARDGCWTLHVQRQVAVDRSVYRPLTQELRGREAILRYFRQHPQHQRLATSAASLLNEAAEAGSPRSFEAIDGEWVPSEANPAPLVVQRQRGFPDSVKLIALQAECLRLRTICSSLAERVTELERRLGNTQGPIASPEPQLTEPALQARRALPEAAPPSSVEPEVMARPAPKEAPAKVRRTMSGSRLRLPEPEPLIRCIEQLLGGDVSVSTSDAPFDVVAEAEGAGVARLVNDSGELVAVVVMSLEGMVYLGGTLLMMPEEDLTTQISTRKPSEDSVAAASEVCSSLCSVINEVPHNDSLRSEPLAEFAAGEFSWLEGAEGSLTLEDNLGGRLLIAVK